MFTVITMIQNNYLVNAWLNQKLQWKFKQSANFLSENAHKPIPKIT